MRWSKIKNIIILLLLVVNGFLLAQVGLRQWRVQRSDRETRERMVAILARNGIEFLPAEVPGELGLTGLRLTLTIPGRAEAELLLDEITAVSEVGTTIVYEGPRGAVACSAAGEIEARLRTGIPTQDDGRGLLESLGVQVRETGRDTGTLATVRYVQLWDGVPVIGQAASVTLRDGAVESLSLRRLAGTAEAVSGGTPITASTALVRLLDELNRGEGYVCSQVTALYPGYTASGTGTVSLTPAWFVETDTWRFVVDGYTGAVTAE